MYDPIAAKKYRDANKDKARAYYENVIKIKNKSPDRKKLLCKRAKDYKNKDVEGYREKEREYYAKNKESILERKRKQRKTPEARKKSRETENARYNSDIKFRLVKNLRNRLFKFFKGTRKSESTAVLLGCSREFLITHLEKQFTDGMNWDNYGFGVDKWSIDHIKPLSLFNLKNPEELKVAAHFTNLQPMWCSDNFSKGNKYDI